MANKLNLEGFSVSDADVCTADGGFVGTTVGSTFGSATFVSGLVTGSSPNNKTTVSTTSLSTQSLVVVTHEGTVFMPNLPTSDPSVAGQLWSNSGVITLSAG